MRAWRPSVLQTDDSTRERRAFACQTDDSTRERRASARQTDDSTREWRTFALQTDDSTREGRPQPQTQWKRNDFGYDCARLGFYSKDKI